MVALEWSPEFLALEAFLLSIVEGINGVYWLTNYGPKIIDYRILALKFNR